MLSFIELLSIGQTSVASVNIRDLCFMWLAVEQHHPMAFCCVKASIWRVGRSPTWEANSC